MITTFRGPESIVDAYSEAIYGQSSLVRVKGLVTSEAALSELAALGGDDPYINEARGRALEIMGNEIPLLGEIDKVAADVRSRLPSHLEAVEGLAGPIIIRDTDKAAHIDTYTLNVNRKKGMAPLLIGPVALSLALTKKAIFGGLRFPRDLSADEMTFGSQELVDFLGRHKQGFLYAHSTDRVTQHRSDGIIIPGAPRPSIHEVGLPLFQFTDKSRKAMCFAAAIIPVLQASLPKGNLGLLREKYMIKQGVPARFLALEGLEMATTT